MLLTSRIHILENLSLKEAFVLADKPNLLISLLSYIRVPLTHSMLEKIADDIFAKFCLFFRGFRLFFFFFFFFFVFFLLFFFSEVLTFLAYRPLRHNFWDKISGTKRKKCHQSVSAELVQRVVEVK